MFSYRFRNWVILIDLIIFLIVTQPTQAQSGQIKVGDSLDLARYELLLVGGEQVAYNQPVVIDFWATWCGPCIAAFPHLDSISKLYVNRIQIVALSDENPEKVTKFFNNNTYSFAYYIDKGKSLFRLFAIDSRPQTVLISATGKLLWVGNSSYLEQVIESYLNTGAIDSNIGTGALSQKYYSKISSDGRSNNLLNYQIGYSNNIDNYLVRSQKGPSVDSAINIEYNAVTVSELLQDLFELPYLQFNNTRDELDTIFIDLIAKSNNAEMTYNRVSKTIVADLQTMFNFQIIKTEKEIDAYEIVIANEKQILQYEERVEGGGMVENNNDSIKVVRLSLEQIAYHFEKKYKVFITYNGSSTAKYTFTYKYEPSLLELEKELLEKFGIQLIKSKQMRQFITIK